LRPTAFSILRCPGSKGWFVPYAERFVRKERPKTIVDAFAGTGVVGLTLLNSGYGQCLVLAEKDPELRHFFNVALRDAGLAIRVRSWTHKLWAIEPQKQRDFAFESVEAMATTDPAFSVLLRTRLQFNGIMKRAVSARTPARNWWSLNLGTSLELLYNARHKIQVFGDAFEALDAANRRGSYAFVDPPYTVSRYSAGHKLYRVSEVDHEALLRSLAAWRGSWQLTSELCPEILRMAREVDPELSIRQYVVPMRTVMGSEKMELVLARSAR
jgi:site-specific DNA-adenine methylase